MNSLDAMHDYYSGQRTVTIAGAAIALAYLLPAWPVFRRAATAGCPFPVTVFLVAGLFMLPANIAYFFYVGPQSARIEATLKRDLAVFHTSEKAHLDKMMCGFQHSYRLDSTVVLAGFLLSVVGFFLRNNNCTGIGLALALCASTLLAGEVWSKQRALHYREALLTAL